MEAGHQVDERPTKPTEPALECRDGDCDAILTVVGGDGTMRLLAPLASNFKAVTFLGRGTANVLSFEFGLRRNPVYLAKHWDSFVTHQHRAGLAGQQPFLMMWSAGIDAATLKNTTQRLKNRLGKAAFAWSGLKTWFTYTFPTIEIITDHGSFQGTWAVVSRIRRYGGNFAIHPHPPKGLEVLVYQRSGKWASLAMFWALIRGRTGHKNGFVRISCSHVRLAYPHGSVPNQLDGDAINECVEHIELAPYSVLFLAPP